MVFFCDANGTITQVSSSPVYQGSNLANEIILAAPFSSGVQITVSFTLPNGIITTPYYMESTGYSGVTDKDGKQYNTWSALVDMAVTEYSGSVVAQFTIYTPGSPTMYISAFYQNVPTYTNGQVSFYGGWQIGRNRNTGGAFVPYTQIDSGQTSISTNGYPGSVNGGGFYFQGNKIYLSGCLPTQSYVADIQYTVPYSGKANIGFNSIFAAYDSGGSSTPNTVAYNIAIYHNDTCIFPADGGFWEWQTSQQYTTDQSFDLLPTITEAGLPQNISVEQGDTISVWIQQGNAASTVMYVNPSISFYEEDQNPSVVISTSSTGFYIQKGVPIELPAQPSDDIYQQILSHLSVLNVDISAQINEATQAANAANTAAAAANSAATAANQAADSATSATSGAIEGAQQATEAAKSANTAAQSATEAASSANSAAYDANVGAGKANIFASLAQDRAHEAEDAAEAANAAATSATQAANSATAAAATATSSAQNANNAANTATSAAQSATTAAETANTAASSAASAAQSANTAASAANTAADTANKAADAANAAAASVNEAITNAESAATAANNAADAANSAAESATNAASSATSAASGATTAADAANTAASSATSAAQNANSAAEAAQAVVDQAQQIFPRYGVQFQGGANTGSTVTRLYNAVGLVAGVGTDTETAQNDFDTIYPWSARRRCCGAWNADGTFTVNAYKGEPGYTEDGSNGGVWVEHSLFYYMHTNNGDTEEICISETPLPGYSPAPIFQSNNGQGAPYQKAYTAAFPMPSGSTANTIAGVYTGGKSINSAIESAAALGGNYTITTTAEWYTECLYMWVEFATRNLKSIMAGASSMPYSANDTAAIAEQNTNRIVIAASRADEFVIGQTIGIGTSVGDISIANRRIITGIESYDDNNSSITFDGDPVNISVGNVVFSVAWPTGSCNSVISSSGSPVSNTSGKYNCVYRGKESPYGSANEFIADVLFQTEGDGTTESPYVYYIYFLPDPTKYENGSITSDYVKLNYTLPTSRGYVQALGEDDRFPWVRIPSETGGTATTYYSGYFSAPSNNTISVARVGGSWSGGAFNGMCRFDCAQGVSSFSPGSSARLSYHRK